MKNKFTVECFDEHSGIERGQGSPGDKFKQIKLLDQIITIYSKLIFLMDNIGYNPALLNFYILYK